MESSDYNQEQFFALEDEWEEYERLMDWEEEKEIEFGTNIFLFEQTLSTLREIMLDENNYNLTNLAEEAIAAIENFIDEYIKE